MCSNQWRIISCGACRRNKIHGPLDGILTAEDSVKSHKIFKIGRKKSLRGDHRTKGGTIGKKFFRNVFLLVQNDCFDEKNVFDGFKAL